MDKELKEASPYMHYWLYEEAEVLKEIYCEKCGRSLRWRSCDWCGHSLDEWA